MFVFAGNDFINILTNDGVYNLRVIVEDWQHTSRYADYRAFRIGDEDHDYYLSIWGYSGNAGSLLIYILNKSENATPELIAIYI